ncbi:MAG: hypothetical protein HGB12_14655, partial [Bacteroidetes bacterium]|nr:hypothetical protein [Bacteroidota bacterium]
MKKNLILFFFLFILLRLNVVSQVLSYSPLYPKVNDTITIIYNASLGNAALAGVSNVYMHTGVITDESVNLSDWIHKPAIWNEADSTVLMEDLGNNLHRAKFHIKSFYHLNTNENTKELCFVFRNADGTIAGRNSDNSDFFINVYQSGVFARFTSPLEFPLCPNINSTFPVKVFCTENAMINLFHEGNLISQIYDSVITTNITASQYGKHKFWFTAENENQTISDTLYYLVRQAPNIQDAPEGTKDGINYINDSTVVLQLFAPNKNFVYLIWDNSNWELAPEYQLNKTID